MVDVGVAYREGSMKLWTVQPVEFWQNAREKGVLRCDGRKLGFQNPEWREDFYPYYQWMREQLKKRIPGYGLGCSRIPYPIWCYVKKPDLRSVALGIGGTQQVRIGFEIPEEKVLISDYDLWHIPLNNGYLGTSEEDDDVFDREVELRTGRKFARMFDEDYPQDLREMIFDSWERIFPARWHELDNEWHGINFKGRVLEDRLNDSRWYDLQACVEEVQLECVTETKEFTTRRSSFDG